MPNSLDIKFQNQTDSSEVYAYVTGLALQHNNARVLLKANGRDLYYPVNPSGILQPLKEDCAIPLGKPGNTVTVHIPQLAGGRIWLSRNAHLTFLLNPSPAGPVLVEPSVLNPGDPNAKVDFAFAEFTLNNDQLYANISYVDFVPRLPVALTLQEPNGAVQHVSGMAEEGLRKVCDGLRAQAAKDHKPWDKLIVQDGKGPLRALNPTHGNALGASFDGYYEPFVDQVWRKYRNGPKFRINTQSPDGILEGQTHPKDDVLVIGGERFSRPTTADILGSNSGPFVTGPSAKRNAIIPRLAAALLRTSLVAAQDQPSHPNTYYTCDPTNHYCRLVHLANLDGKGYAFAYDDVTPDGGVDISGKVNAGNPSAFIVSVGGRNAYAGDKMPY
ncbi:glucanase B [Thozetella sp. PMI_491]|nr:glucanase B [Thozetella sp. PMI_491]